MYIYVCMYVCMYEYLKDGIIRASSVTSVKASLDSQLEEAKQFTVKRTYVILWWVDRRPH